MTTRKAWLLPVSFLAVLLLTARSAGSAAEPKTRNLVLVTLDGARTQEVFEGADLELLKGLVPKDGKLEDLPLYKKLWAPTPAERREKLLPFFWGMLVAKHGSIAGDRAVGSTAHITNKHRFSYPGYSEILTGEARDDLIKTNDKKLNPSPTVLEFLKKKLALDGRQVAAFCSWDVLDSIVMHEADAFTSNAGLEAYEHPDPTVRLLSGLQTMTETPWDSVRHDLYTFRFAMAHLKSYRPRVLYIGFGQPDDWSHDGRYDRVLEAYGRIDGFLHELWDYLESADDYRGKTTLVITTDHGRGNTTSDWKDHGEKVEGAQYIWMAFVSPDSNLRGEWRDAGTVLQSQIAATLCRFVGLDYAEANPHAGKPIERLFESAP